MSERIGTMFTVVLFALAALALPLAANAAIVPDACRAGGSGCNICYLAVTAINIANFLIYDAALPAAAALVAIGGIMLLISGASEERRTLGKKMLTSTLIGIIIVLVAWLAVDTVMKIFTGTIGFTDSPAQLNTEWGPWNKVNPTKCALDLP